MDDNVQKQATRAVETALQDLSAVGNKSFKPKQSAGILEMIAAAKDTTELLISQIQTIESRMKEFDRISNQFYEGK